MALIQKSIGVAAVLLLSLDAVLLASVLDNPVHTTFAQCEAVVLGNCIASERSCSTTTASGDDCIIPSGKQLQEITKKTEEGIRLKEKIAAQGQRWETTSSEFWCRDSSATKNRIKCKLPDLIGIDRSREAIGCGYKSSLTEENHGTVIVNDATPFVSPNRFAKSTDGKKLYVCVQAKYIPSKLTAEEYVIEGDGKAQIAKLEKAGIKAMQAET